MTRWYVPLLFGWLSALANSHGRPLPVGSPESVGLDAAKLEQAIATYAEAAGGAGASQLVVTRAGTAVWRGPEAGRVRGTRGLPKAVSTLVFGLLLDTGIIALDQPVAQHEPRFAALYPQATYRHFLTHTSGYLAIDDTIPHAELFKSPPRADPFLPEAPKHAPGTSYQPSDTAIVAAVLAATRAAGRSFDELFWAGIGAPIGIERDRFAWGAYVLPDGTRINGGAGHFHGIESSADEFAKIAVLLAHDGNWNGRQLLSRQFMAAITELQADRPQPNPKYAPSSFIFRALGVHSRRRPDLPDLPIRTTWSMASRNTWLIFVPEWQLGLVRLADERTEKDLGSESLVRLLAEIGAAMRGRDGDRAAETRSLRAVPDRPAGAPR